MANAYVYILSLRLGKISLGSYGHFENFIVGEYWHYKLNCTRQRMIKIFITKLKNV